MSAKFFTECKGLFKLMQFRVLKQPRISCELIYCICFDKDNQKMTEAIKRLSSRGRWDGQLKKIPKLKREEMSY